MATTNEAGADTKSAPAIDPTVPLQGFPVEAIHSAEWQEEEEIVTAHGFERRIKRKYPKLNGFVFNENTPPNVWRQTLEWFPKVPVMIPETDDERARRERSRSFRAAERIYWNGVPFSMPKGVPVMVPQPIADMVNHLNEIFRTQDVKKLIEELEAQLAGSPQV